MARIFNKTFSVIKTSTNRIVLKATDDGKFTFNDSVEVHKLCEKFAKELNAEYKPFVPTDEHGRPTIKKADMTPVILMDRWGKPYVAMLDKTKAPSKVDGTVAKKSGPVVLA